jgi:hypothetical protein
MGRTRGVDPASAQVLGQDGDDRAEVEAVLAGSMSWRRLANDMVAITSRIAPDPPPAAARDVFVAQPTQDEK